MPDFGPFIHAMVEGDGAAASRWVGQALAAGEDAARIVREGVMPAMDEVERRFANNDYFMPELLVAARTLRTVQALLRPHLASGALHPAGVAVLVPTPGDAHGLAGVLLSALLEGAGFAVVEMGEGASPPSVIAAVREHRPSLLCLNVASVAVLPQVRELLEAVNRSDDRRSFRVLVVGSAIDQRVAEDNGADAHAEHALAAVHQARMWSRI